MKFLLHIIFFIITIVPLPSMAQITFKARVSKHQVSTGERFRVSFDIVSNKRIQPDNFIAPNFTGFKKSGPIPSQQYSNINGEVSYQFSFLYYLQATKPGKYEIKPAKITINGETYETQPFTIIVTQDESNTNSISPPIGQPNSNKKNSNITIKDDIKGAFLSVSLSKNNPYVNEAVGLAYKLYIPQNYGVLNYNETEQPQFNGFWAQDLSKNISGPFQETVKGHPYTYYILRKKILFPQQSGKLTIQPLNLQIDVQVPVYRNFFGMRVPDYEVQRVKLSSGKKIVNVKPLPTQNQPVDFSGAVGQFDFSVQIDKNNIDLGNPVHITVQVKGTGNLKLFDLPVLKAPEELEVYDPQHSESIQPTFNGNKGTISDKYIVIPNQPGKFIIPGMRFVYFDPKSKSYITKTTDDLVLLVSANNYVNQSNNIQKSGDTYQGTDFRFIKEKARFIDKNKKDFYKSKLFYGILSVIVFLIFILTSYHYYLKNKVVNPTIQKQKKNKSLAQKFLKDAKKSLEDKEMFYANLEKAIHNFLKAKLQIDTHEMTRQKIRQKLTEKGVKNETIDELINLLNRCDMARYAPVSQNKKEEDLKDAEQIMNKI